MNIERLTGKGLLEIEQRYNANNFSYNFFLFNFKVYEEIEHVLSIQTICISQL